MIISKPCVTHTKCMQTMHSQSEQQWLTKHICLREAGKTPFATNQNDCLSWRCIFQNLQSKSPWQSFSGFLSAYTKQGSGGRSVGPWALKGFSEAALTGTTLPQGLMMGGPVSNDVKSAQWRLIYTPALLRILFLHRYIETRIVGKYSSQSYTGPICTLLKSQHVVRVCLVVFGSISDCFKCIQYCWC